MERFDVTARIGPATSVQEVSKVFEGLCRLERLGSIRLKLEAERMTSDFPRLVQLAARRGADERSIAIDLADQRSLFDPAALERADVYFKRSFSPEVVDALPPWLRAKVEPFGLNQPVISQSATASVLAARVRTGRSWRGLLADTRQLLALPSPAAFECPPDIPAEPLVLFQARVWEPLDGDPLTIAINHERVALVRALRHRLGGRFLGGIVPSAFARRFCPDAITALPVAMRAYPQVVKRALIGISTRGLHHSIPFKLSEYLAAGRCIVAHEPGGLLPKPLVAGRHYLPFTNPEDCATRCEELLGDPSRALEMRVSNWDHWRSEAEPAAHLLKILERAFSRATGNS